MPCMPRLPLTLFRMIHDLLAFPTARKGHHSRLNFETVDPPANFHLDRSPRPRFHAGQHGFQHQWIHPHRRDATRRKWRLPLENDPLRLWRHEETAEPRVVLVLDRDVLQSQQKRGLHPFNVFQQGVHGQVVDDVLKRGPVMGPQTPSHRDRFAVRLELVDASNGFHAEVFWTVVQRVDKASIRIAMIQGRFRLVGIESFHVFEGADFFVEFQEGRHVCGGSKGFFLPRI